MPEMIRFVFGCWPTPWRPRSPPVLILAVRGADGDKRSGVLPASGLGVGGNRCGESSRSRWVEC